MVNTNKPETFCCKSKNSNAKKTSLSFISPLLAELLKKNNATTKGGGCCRADIMHISCI